METTSKYKLNHLNWGILSMMERQLEESLVKEGDDPSKPENARCMQCGRSANTTTNIDHKACPLEHMANLMAFYEEQGIE